MIRLNVHALMTYLVVFVVVWFGFPVWLTLALWLAEQSAVRWLLGGFVAGCCVPTTIGWNLALRHRRAIAIEKAEREYTQDKKTLWG